MFARRFYIPYCGALAMVACGGSSTTLPDAPAPLVRGCEAIGSAATFCDDFDGSGEDASPFGFLKVETDGTAHGTTFASNVIDSNRVLSISETEGSADSLIAAGISPILPLTGAAVSLQLDVQLIGSNAPSTGIASLVLADDTDATFGIDVLVGSDGSVSLAENMMGLSTTAILASATWTTFELHVAVGSGSATLSVDAGPPGGALQSVLASTNVALPLTPTQAQVLVELDPRDMIEHDAEFDNVALTMP